MTEPSTAEQVVALLAEGRVVRVHEDLFMRTLPGGEVELRQGEDLIMMGAEQVVMLRRFLNLTVRAGLYPPATGDTLEP